MLAFAIMVSCSQPEELTNRQDALIRDVPDHIKTKLQQAGFHTTVGLRPFEHGFVVEYDIFLTEADIDELIRVKQASNAGRTQHYRTVNLVTAPRTIPIFIDPTFSTTVQFALDEAIKRFNDEKISLKFERTTNKFAAKIKITPYNDSTTPYENYGMTGIPSADGNPAGEIKLNTYYFTSQPRTGYVTEIAHHIGHAIGFQHTDFMQITYSCLFQGSDNSPGGFTYIPGTPTGPAPSWMLSCNPSLADRPFTADDKLALKTVYPSPLGSLLLGYGENLYSNQSVTSSDGRFTLVMQGDGNLVTYQGSQAIWASNTADTPVTRCSMQVDGNLVLYDDAGAAHWHTGTYQYPGAYLTIQDNGALTIIHNNIERWRSGTSNPPPGSNVLGVGESLSVGQSKTSLDRRFTLVMQGDGNLVLYQGSQPLWHTQTPGTPATTCVMQTDGNLVLYGSNGVPYWSSGTHMYPGSILTLENDGNMRITQNGTLRWSSNTGGR